ncbi:MAG TPA: serine/threonine-protein kinase [Flavisolibacter sp.]|nr:serine/threonine-protein kinase [Flavisolibacter sp.]
MAKVFTITEGLENLGAIRSGGQGSVYKGKRMGEIISAVKLLPTPILSEDASNKNYTDFQNEVQKLRRVNETPNPNVVRIIGSGITETGCFPFIEMEFIEGPDLGELLRPPHEPVFTIRESIRVAEHLANAIAHCHRQEVKHGDIKSNNVKYSIHTGNYVLLDFGLAVMSDEQRRTSLRHAGAIEFMAPEQNEGQMLYQSDVYSFGIILFELLAGQVPFPLQDNGETARNHVRLAHMENPLPDLLELREKNMPVSWPAEKRETEKGIPAWLVETIYKCLEKDPAQRFENGNELHEHINANITGAAAAAAMGTAAWLKDKERMEQRIKDLELHVQDKERELSNLQSVSGHRETNAYTAGDRRKTVSRSSFQLLMVLSLILASLAVYGLFFHGQRGETLAQQAGLANDSGETYQDSVDNLARSERTGTAKKSKPGVLSKRDSALQRISGENEEQIQSSQADSSSNSEQQQPEEENEAAGRYKVRTKAYFHDDPDEGTKRDAFIVHWNNAVLTPLDEKNGFIYVVFTNHLGQTSKGWLSKKDLVALK